MRDKSMESRKKQAVLMAASVASMIDQFNMPNIRLLLDMGYDVHVACDFKHGNTCDARRIRKLLETLQDMHVGCHQWDCPRSLRSAAACVRAYRQLVRLMQRISFGWVHCHSPIGGALARIAAHRTGVGVIYTAHGFHFYKGAPVKNWLLYYPAEKLLAHWTDVLVTVNQEDTQFARRHLRAGQIRRISGVGIETARFQKHIAAQGADADQAQTNTQKRMDFRRKYQIPENAQILLSVGELSRRKNHQAVLTALAGLQRKDVYYMICGQGALREKLMRQARELGIAGGIRMPGYLEDVKSLYEQADIFVFPSLQEGLPAALMEAMAAGLPCVASDIRGNRELIDKNGGGLVSPGHAIQMQEKIRELLEDPDLRQKCGRYNQEKIKAFSLDVVRRQMKRIYELMEQDPAVTSNHGAADGKRMQTVEQEFSDREWTSRNRIRKRGPGTGRGRIAVQRPEISVIMAVYQAADGQALKKAVHSICMQSYAGWELLICDDGSTDHTWKVLKRLAASDSRIRLLRLKKNHKAGYARNKCIRAARGQYVAVMDADDISAPDRLKRQLDFLKSHPDLAFAGARGEYFIQETGDDGELYPFCKKPEATDFLFSLPYVHASLMFRKEALERVHGYDAGRSTVRAEDYDLLLRLYGEGLYGANLDDVLYYIRRDKDQYRRRKYRYRFHEAFVKYRNFRKLGLMPEGIFYAGKPLLVGLLPAGLVKRLQQRYYRAKERNVMKGSICKR